MTRDVLYPTRRATPVAVDYATAHPAWSAAVAEDDPRLEAMCRRFCEMGGMHPDMPVRGLGWASRTGRGDTAPCWTQYRLAMAQYLAAADAVDPLRGAQ